MALSSRFLALRALLSQPPVEGVFEITFSIAVLSGVWEWIAEHLRLSMLLLDIVLFWGEKYILSWTLTLDGDVSDSPWERVFECFFFKFEAERAYSDSAP